MLGHQFGDELLGYLDARKQVYLPAYQWVLENRLQSEAERLRKLWGTGDIVLLDYETNGDVEDLSRPLSHATLVANHIHPRWYHSGFGTVLLDSYRWFTQVPMPAFKVFGRSKKPLVELEFDCDVSVEPPKKTSEQAKRVAERVLANQHELVDRLRD